MAKISVQQRKYFVERINQSINDKISDLKQINAADVQKISEKEYDNYLKVLKIDKEMKELKKVKDREETIMRNMTAIYDELLKAFNLNSWEANVPSVYKGSDWGTIDSAFRFACSKTAQKQETETPAGKVIKELESKKRAACDILHGINDLEELTSEVNAILKGSDVPMLGA